MQYRSVKKGIFRARPNRFIAHVEVDGGLEVVHVKIPADAGSCWCLAPRSIWRRAITLPARPDMI